MYSTNHVTNRSTEVPNMMRVLHYLEVGRPTTDAPPRFFASVCREDLEGELFLTMDYVGAEHSGAHRHDIVVAVRRQLELRHGLGHLTIWRHCARPCAHGRAASRDSMNVGERRLHANLWWGWDRRSKVRQGRTNASGRIRAGVSTCSIGQVAD